MNIHIGSSKSPVNGIQKISKKAVLRQYVIIRAKIFDKEKNNGNCS